MDGLLPLLIVAQLTYTIVGGSVFVGLPSTVQQVLQVCVNHDQTEICVTPPDNAVVIHVPWPPSVVTTVKALVVEVNGMHQWHMAYPLPPFVGD